MEKDSYFAVLQRIREEETERPSERVRHAADKEKIAELRQTHAGGLTKLLARELDWIVKKALEKDRTRRYETVNGLARDLQHYLEGEPVLAAPPSAMYRTGKFVRKHKAWLLTAAAFATVLVAAVVVSLWMAVRASRARTEAQAVSDFLQNDLLAQASAYNQRAGAKPDPNLTVRTALDRAASRIEGKFAEQPLLDASIRQKIGAVYVDLGLYPEAERQFERALALRRKELGGRNPDTLITMGSLAAVYERGGKAKRAETLYREELELSRKVLGERDPLTLKTMNGLAVTCAEEGDFAQAGVILEQLVPLEQSVLGEQDLQTLRAMGNLAAVYDTLQKRDLAEPLYLKTLELKRRALGDENPETLDTMTNLGIFYGTRGDDAKAIGYQSTAVEAYRRIMGETHPSTIVGTNILADSKRQSGQNAEARALFERALAAAAKRDSGEHPYTLASEAGLAATYERDGDFARAEELFAKAAECGKRVLGEAHPDTLVTVVGVNRMRVLQKKYAAAGAELRPTLEAYQKVAPDAWQRYEAEWLLGASLAGQSKTSEAEPLLVHGYEGLAKRKSTMPASDQGKVAQAGERLVAFYRECGKADRAAEWEKKLH